MPLNEVDKFMYDEGRLSLLQELLACDRSPLTIWVELETSAPVSVSMVSFPPFLSEIRLG